MRKTFNILSVIALVTVVLGALNWLVIGIFSFNTLTWLSFGMPWLERAFYCFVGIAGIYMLIWLIASRAKMVEEDRYRQDNYIKRANQRN